MAKLLGKKVDDIVVEVFGPQNSRNYMADGTFSTLVTPEVAIQVFGSGSVQLQENVEHIIVGERASNIGGQGAINTETAAAPDIPPIPVPPTPAVINWNPVGAVITQASGLQTRLVTVGNPDPTFLRLIVIATGDGWVHFETKWN